MSNNINRYRILPPSAGRRPDNQFYRREQTPDQSRGETDEPAGRFDESSFQSPETKVPRRGVGLDIFGEAPVGTNSYLVAEWEKTSAALGESVRIKAVLDKGLDGVVRVQVIHDFDGRQVWVESVNGFMNKGVVTAAWVAKNTITEWRKGEFLFTIIGGRANAVSANRLKIG